MNIAGVDVRRAVLAHKWLILAFMLATAAVAFLTAQVLPPKFVSTAELYIDPQSLQILDKPLTPANDGGASAIDQVESQSRVITSRSVLKRVVESLHLDQDSYFSAGGGTLLNNAIDALATKVAVRRPERTFVVTVSVTTNTAEKSAAIANAVAQAYIDQSAEIISQAANRTSTTLAGRLDDLKAQAARAQGVVEDFKQKNDLAGTRKDLVSEDQLTGTNTELLAAQARTALAQARYDQVRAAHNSNDAAALTEALHSQTISALRTQQAEAKRKLAELAADLGPMHPQVHQAQMTIRELGKSIDDEIQRIVISAKSDLARAKDNENAVGKMLMQMKTQSIVTSAALAKLRELESEAAAAQTLYQNVLLRSRETGEFGKLNSSNIRIISQAAPAAQRAFPPRNAIVVAAGAVGGALLGFLAAFGLEMAPARTAGYRLANPFRKAGPRARPAPRPAVKDAEKATPASRWQVPDRAPAGEPAEIPDLAGAGDVADISPVASLPHDVFGQLDITARDIARAFQPSTGLSVPDLATIGLPIGTGSPLNAQVGALCSALNIPESGAGSRLLVFAGANQDDSRSIAALNVALRAASVGLKVMLVDADFGAERLSTHLTMFYPDWPDQLGPRDILPTLNHVDLALRRPNAAMAHNPFYAMRLLRQVLQSARDYDVVVFDGPGLAPSRPGSSLFGHADQIMLVQAGGRPSGSETRGFAQTLGEFVNKFRGRIVVELPVSTVRHHKA